MFEKIAIVGTGLIGGSMAMVIKKKGLAKEIIGVSRHENTILLAKRNHIIDRGSRDLSIIKDADLVILATPVGAILKSAPIISKIVRKDCIITDVGSTKREIVSKLERLFSRYIGSHPLAGSEKRGVLNASSDIFKNSLCILTPTRKTDKEALAKMRRLWSLMGTKIVVLSPQGHDTILSFISHLPHIAAFSLISAIPKKYLELAPTGLRDTTRIAASDNQLWRDIFLSNQKNVVKAIELFEECLFKIKSSIKRRDSKNLDRILREARLKRITLE